jgi:IS30 family transposase
MRRGKYKSDLTQRKYNHRNKIKPNRIVFNDVMKQKVNELLKEDYSTQNKCMEAFEYMVLSICKKKCPIENINRAFFIYKNLIGYFSSNYFAR